MFNTAFKLHSQGKLDEAEKIYREILDKEPENAQVYNLLGLIKLTKKELMAKQHLEEMVEITKKIGFADLKIEKKNPKTRIEKTKEIEKEN